jgi:hypothetical protein
MYQDDALRDPAVYADWLLQTFSKADLAEKVRLMTLEDYPQHVPGYWFFIADDDELLAEIDTLPARDLVGLLCEGRWYEGDITYHQYVADTFLPAPSPTLSAFERCNPQLWGSRI